MPSDNKKKRDARKKQEAKNRLLKLSGVEAENEENGVEGENGGEGENGVNGVDGKIEEKNGAKEIEKLGDDLDDLALAAKFRSCTGVLTSHAESRDIHIDHLSMRFHGAELLMNTSLNLNVGRRYGLIGTNGCGKSSLLSALESRELPIPRHTDIYLLRREMAASDKTALQAVMEVEEEKLRLEREAEELSDKTDQDSMDQLMDIYERLDDMDASKTEAQAAYILHGLGFTKEMQTQKVKNFSGGWRMRIALARVLLIKPGLLLLDEPTNHLDLDACVWLENELKTYKRILVVISHSQDFLNGVCTNIIHFHLQILKIYTGNYDSYVQTRFELEENQMKRYKSEQDQISHMKNYIARFGHGSAKLARQAQSKEKVLKKMVDGGLTEKVSRDYSISFVFPSCGKIPPPVIMVQHVSFRYADGKPLIYQNLDFGVDLDTRVALVGPNGAGKSTLLNLIVGDLAPTDGLIRRHSHLRIARYHQHLQDQLNLDMSALDWMMAQFPDIKEREEMRKIVGRYGLSGPQQICPIRNLSDGQRCRVIFAWLAWQTPHMLLLDEPTNHLDIETIDVLAEALNDFEGGIMLVSHDFRLISQVAQEIWVCEKQTVTKWDGDIYSYKEALVKRVQSRNSKLKKMKK